MLIRLIQDGSKTFEKIPNFSEAIKSVVLNFRMARYAFEGDSPNIKKNLVVKSFRSKRGVVFGTYGVINLIKITTATLQKLAAAISWLPHLHRALT